MGINTHEQTTAGSFLNRNHNIRKWW